MRRTAFIDGIGFWSRGLPDWPSARAALRGEAAVVDDPRRRPNPTSLAANERRRAPDAVLLALQVAEEAVAMSGHPAAELASVFTSAHGDLPIVDALCRTLASEPMLLSPTRFHHSVHNAASGYWAIASGSRAASTALAGFRYSFGAGLLEALVQVASEHAPVLLVGCDTEAVGALASVNRSRGLLGVALVLAPARGTASRWRLDWETAAPPAEPPALRSTAVRALAANAQADALPLAEALAQGEPAGLALAAGAGTGVALRLATPATALFAAG